MSSQPLIHALLADVKQRIIGQDRLLLRLFTALLADGHLLVEGAPGLAKTRAIQVLSSGIQGSFCRIQFTPDLLPADLTGTEIFHPQQGSFSFRHGPLFHNLILADEINRAPAKVQSALLEAMGERQISVGSTSHPLPELFLVMATQNPIEQEGTHPLPEAQLDRFLLLVRIDYPSLHEERAILELVRKESRQQRQGAEPIRDPLPQTALFAARQEILQVHMAKAVEEYLLQLIMATRQPQLYGNDLATILQYGASPRATLALDRCARANAWLLGRHFVTPDDIQDLLPDVLRHRIQLTYHAEANGLTPDQVISMLLERVPAP
ncbi:AAA family ATPase [Candidatus Magnetaquicoccus inordinatus]|uniref:AAA family ATPase n=1 Tax=Candidatus Magnetaquicoccus inordinatus TaxID=2496818 RepID=UPI00102C8B04|nr:MoxR family ATPase [Candidatus Magnetaquicoccus inordinatus]